MAVLKIGSMVLGICQTNCYYLYREGSTQVIVVDPADRGDYIYQTLTDIGFQVEGILLTHGHFDHIWGSKELRELCGAKIYAYEGEREVCENAENNASAQVGRAYVVQPDVYLKDGEKITLADIVCRLIATPGHTEGSCCYFLEDDGVLISGDTLFQESVGRTDLPTGSMGALIRSIKERLFVLPDTTRVYPGHGDMTEIGLEKKYNPFCQ